MNPLLNSAVCLIAGVSLGAGGLYQQVHKPAVEKYETQISALNDSIQTSKTESANAIETLKQRDRTAYEALKQQSAEQAAQAQNSATASQAKTERLRKDLDDEKARTQDLTQKLDDLKKKLADIQTAQSAQPEPTATPADTAPPKPKALPVPSYRDTIRKQIADLQYALEAAKTKRAAWDAKQREVKQRYTIDVPDDISDRRIKDLESQISDLQFKL